ncbi:hypothetical protein C1631_012650 [Chryseobacterium phosphatilyticum]|uniref:Uncharacterized protein n=1 Tax=Chryseobacterium phosphatilyticum TaxID=475075 RepID=A0A316XC37_9FLAO|nr:hypothetical protein [Chryseobacterium phosphatilyticum]PWN68918.1 hypothetical protein C1631_012650 [Chryseobacterium phosphatilyticum]
MNTTEIKLKSTLKKLSKKEQSKIIAGQSEGGGTNSGMSNGSIEKKCPPGSILSPVDKRTCISLHNPGVPSPFK